jgi:general L-amino acid transport system substrate-binding protein
MRSTAVENPGNYRLHEEIISKEPLVAYVNAGDMIWGNLVRWTIYATIFAEEKGITRDNYREFFDSSDAEVRRFLGVESMEGNSTMGLSDDWARNVVAGSGNYGEIFDRYLGEQSDIKLSRGLNALWRDGGLMFSPPFR